MGRNIAERRQGKMVVSGGSPEPSSLTFFWMPKSSFTTNENSHPPATAVNLHEELLS